MILSVHIPKTAGSRLREVLKRRYGKRLALYYGTDSERTHPLVRRRQGRFDEKMFDDLEAEGIEVLHGHFRVASTIKFRPDPKRYWVWVREPVEQTVSHYYFLKQKLGLPNHHRDLILQGDLSLEQFAAHEKMMNFQSRWVKPFDLADMGFVGVAELMPRMLPLIGLADTAAGGNVNPDKPMVDLATRHALAALLTEDVALYSEAMELAMRRLGGREARASTVQRIAAAVGRLRAG